MKGYIPNAFLFADRYDDKKTAQASGVALEDGFLKGKENIKMCKWVIQEVI